MSTAPSFSRPGTVLANPLRVRALPRPASASAGRPADRTRERHDEHRPENS